ncbi:MAG TPA: hypothetical protein VFW31_07385 [Candidatus Angelobacter sp.]|nr:hypothetical protein [Candidatus Angelobacter sp.]
MGTTYINVNPRKRSRTYLLLSVLMLFISPLVSPQSVATGHFEVYCDGVGIFLARIDGVPAPGKLVLFSVVGFPPGPTGSYIGQGQWSKIYVFPDGCVPDGKCKSIASGRVWIDGQDAQGNQNTPPTHISGKYEIKLNSKHLEGAFVAKLHNRKRPLRICM